MLTLGPEVEVGSQLTALVVASEHNYVFRTVDFHGKDQQQYLDGEVASIHVIPEEDVLGGLAVASHI